MAETTKRARSPSPLETGSESKRAKEEEEKEQAAAAQKSLESDQKKVKEMTTEGTMANMASKSDEVDAVDVGLAHEGEEADMQGGEENEEMGDENHLQHTDILEANDSGHVDADGQPANIAIRALIVTGDASVIIGKQGKHINEVRDKSGAKLTIVSAQVIARRCGRVLIGITTPFRQSESLPGNPERILTVAGALDAVSKVGTQDCKRGE